MKQGKGKKKNLDLHKGEGAKGWCGFERMEGQVPVLVEATLCRK